MLRLSTALQRAATESKQVNLQMLFGGINALSLCNQEASGDPEHGISDFFCLPVEMNRENQHSDCWTVPSCHFFFYQKTCIRVML